MTVNRTDPHQAEDRAPRLLEPWSHLTIDGLCRLSARPGSATTAIAEAPDMVHWYHRTPLTLDRAALQSRARSFAGKMLALGLGPGDRVIVQLPNVIDLPVALLGLMSAGMVACPVPVTYGFDDLLHAAEVSGAKAMVTVGRYGSLSLADTARRVAAAVFSIRFLCGFGAPLPDGVVALDAWPDEDVASDKTPNAGDATDIALVTFERRNGSLIALARTHQQLICDALALSNVAKLKPSSIILSTLPPATALGVVAVLVAPALSGAGVHLHGPFNSDVLASQLDELPPAHLLIPAAVERILPPLLDATDRKSARPILAHRWPMPPHEFRSMQQAAMSLIDLHAIGECAVLAAARAEGDALKPIPVRVSHPTPHTLPPATAMLECLLDRESQLTVRGFSVPTRLGSEGASGEDWYPTGLLGSVAGPSSISLSPTRAAETEAA